MKKNLLTATIMGDFGDAPSRRIKLVCQKDIGNEIRYQWREDETGNDTAVSGRTLKEAKIAAAESWGGGDWELKASWLD